MTLLRWIRAKIRARAAPIKPIHKYFSTGRHSFSMSASLSFSYKMQSSIVTILAQLRWFARKKPLLLFISTKATKEEVLFQKNMTKPAEILLVSIRTSYGKLRVPFKPGTRWWDAGGGGWGRELFLGRLDRCG